MKKITTLTIVSMLAGVAGLHAQAFTNPSGYVTHTLKAGQFNLIGLTLHEPIAVSGAFETVSGTTLTDDDVDFDSVLTDGTTYVLEITSGALEGTIQEVLWSSGAATNNIVTSDDLGSDGLAAADTYQIRESASLFSIFGEDNSAGLTEAIGIGSADVVWLVNGSGSFDRYYYSPGGGLLGGTEGWKDSNANDISDVPMVYTCLLYTSPSPRDRG